MSVITWSNAYSNDGCSLTLTPKDSTPEEVQCPKDQNKWGRGRVAYPLMVQQDVLDHMLMLHWLKERNVEMRRKNTTAKEMKLMIVIIIPQFNGHLLPV